MFNTTSSYQGFTPAPFSNNLDAYKRTTSNRGRGSPSDPFPATAPFEAFRCRLHDTFVLDSSRTPVTTEFPCGCDIYVASTDAEARAISGWVGTWVYSAETLVLASRRHVIAHINHQPEILSPSVIGWLLEVQKKAHEQGIVGNIAVQTQLVSSATRVHPEIYLVPAHGDWHGPGEWPSDYGVIIAERQALGSVTTRHRVQLKAAEITGLLTTRKVPTRDTALPLRAWSKSRLEHVVWNLRRTSAAETAPSLVIDSDLARYGEDYYNPRIELSVPNRQLPQPIDDSRYGSILVIEASRTDCWIKYAAKMGNSFARVAPYSLRGQNLPLEVAKTIFRHEGVTVNGPRPVLVLGEGFSTDVGRFFDSRIQVMTQAAYSAGKRGRDVHVCWIHAEGARLPGPGEPKAKMFAHVAAEHTWEYFGPPNGEGAVVENGSRTKPPNPLNNRPYYW